MQAKKLQKTNLKRIAHIGYNNVRECGSHISGHSNTHCGLITGDYIYR